MTTRASRRAPRARPAIARHRSTPNAAPRSAPAVASENARAAAASVRSPARAPARLRRARARATPGADTLRSCRCPSRPAAGTRRSAPAPASTAVTASVCAALSCGGASAGQRRPMRRSPLPARHRWRPGAAVIPSSRASSTRARCCANRHRALRARAAASPSGCAIRRNASSRWRGARFGSPRVTAARPASVSRNHVSVAIAA